MPGASPPWCAWPATRSSRAAHSSWPHLVRDWSRSCGSLAWTASPSPPRPALLAIAPVTGLGRHRKVLRTKDDFWAGNLAMTSAMCDSRLTLPQLPPRHVSRPRLLAKLDDAADSPLTLLAAVPGA